MKRQGNLDWSVINPREQWSTQHRISATPFAQFPKSYHHLLLSKKMIKRLKHSAIGYCRDVILDWSSPQTFEITLEIVAPRAIKSSDNIASHWSKFLKQRSSPRATAASSPPYDICKAAGNAHKNVFINNLPSWWKKLSWFPQPSLRPVFNSPDRYRCLHVSSCHCCFMTTELFQGYQPPVALPILKCHVLQPRLQSQSSLLLFLLPSRQPLGTCGTSWCNHCLVASPVLVFSINS